MSYTKGEWKLTDDGYVTCGESYIHEPNALGGEIVIGDFIPDEVMANARLIAAAPAMYEALKVIRSWIEFDPKLQAIVDKAIAIAENHVSECNNCDYLITEYDTNTKWCKLGHASPEDCRVSTPLAQSPAQNNALRIAEGAMDAINGMYGDEKRLCLFCDSNKHNERGIVHVPSCAIPIARKAIAQAEGRTNEAEVTK